VLYVVRSSRTRHVDRDCPVLTTIDRHVASERNVSSDPATFTSFVEAIPEPPEPALAAWIETFTTPCIRCVPDARELWQSHQL
jgi:hypothetical protein